jgi:phosphomannomutase
MQSAEGSHKTIVGWEVNGGFMLGTDVPFAGGVLQRLPTRDAFLPILVTLFLAAEQNVKVSEVFATLPERYTQAGMIDNFPVEVSKKVIEQMGSEDAFTLIEKFFTAELGYAKPVDINTLDGVRITFSNNEIAHLRPSGNAPQMRIYSVSGSQDRSDEIVAQVIAEPNGILRTIEASLNA